MSFHRSNTAFVHSCLLATIDDANGDYDEAENLMSRLGNGDADTQFQLAKSYWLDGKTNQAAAAATAAISSDSTNQTYKTFLVAITKPQSTP